MKTLLILAECPDNIAAALEYGPGRLPVWVAETLDCSLEGDFDGSPWAEDVARLFGVRAEDCTGAFSCLGARFVDEGVATAAALLLEAAAKRPSVFAPVAESATVAQAKGGAK